MHSEISGCLVNSSRDLFNNMLSPTLATNEVGKHTVELLNLFLNPRSSDAAFDNLTCKWVTSQVLVSISTPLISPRSKPPAQITYLPESLSKLTKTYHHYKVIKIRNIILSVITTWNFQSLMEHNWRNFHLFAGLFCKNRVP
jgi:hypothetical protein